MADEEGGGGGRNDVLFIVMVLVVLVFAWFATGAYKKADLSGIFLQPPAPLGSGEAYGGPSLFAPTIDFSGGGEGSAATDVSYEDNLSPADFSPYYKKVTIERTYGASATNPQLEYITVRAGSGNAENIVFTGWRIESRVTGRGGDIGKGENIFSPDTFGTEGPIVMKSGDEVIIVTGRSPVGISLRENICTGYLAQFQTLEPAPSLICPSPEEEANALYPGYTLDNKCYSYLQSLPQCRIALSFPDDLSQNCRQVVEERLTYQGCVKAHRNDADFSRPLWRIYLGKSEEMWKDTREVIELRDAQGKFVHAVSL